MRRRALKAYWKRLGELAALARPIPRDDMLVRLGKAQEKAGNHAASLVQVEVTPEGKLTYRLDKPKLREARRRAHRIRDCAIIAAGLLPVLAQRALWHGISSCGHDFSQATKRRGLNLSDTGRGDASQMLGGFL